MPEIPTGTVTFLFTDVEGSTRLWEQHPDDMKQRLADHDAALRAAIEESGGYVFSTAGDSFGSAFQSASEALAAAVAAQQELSHIPLPVRMGVHTGEAEEREGDYFGSPLNRAARLMAAGHGGQVLVSGATQELIADQLPVHVSLIELGEHRLKDLTRPERVFQLAHPSLPAEFPPLDTLDRVPNNLPVQLTSFVGRDQDIAEVEKALTGARLVTLAGAGGAGKTRLALQVAADTSERYPDGVWFVDLAPVAEPGLVAKTVVAALGLSEQPGLEPTMVLLAYLRSRKSLLVLDNCEHLVEAAAALTSNLLTQTQNVRLLATSQERLLVPGEVVVQVTAMDLPPVDVTSREQVVRFDAVRLFAERGEVSVPGFRITDENASAVSSICHGLDGQPLALELAAARLVLFTPEQIASRLGERFALLAGGGRTAMERHQTLRAAIEWSHDLLDEDEQRLFRRLGVFVGDFDLEAVESVCPDDDLRRPSVLDLMGRLVDKSLVGVIATQEERRYRLLESIREFASERLRDAAEERVLKDRHAHYYKQLSVEARDGLLGPEVANWIGRVDASRDNLTAALSWLIESDQAEASVVMAGALAPYWLTRRAILEGLEWMRRAAVSTKEVSSIARVEMLGWAGTLATVAAEQEEAIGLADAAMALAEELGDRLAVAHANHHRGLVETDDIALATRHLETAAKGFSEAGSPWAIRAQVWVGYHYFLAGDLEAAEATLEKTLGQAREIGQLVSVVAALDHLGLVARAKGNLDDATRLHEECVELAYQSGSTWLLTGALTALGRDRLDAGDARAAVELFEESIRLQPGSILSLQGTYARLAEALRHVGDHEASKQALVKSLENAAQAAEGGLFMALGTPLLVGARLIRDWGNSEIAALLVSATERRRREVGVSMSDPERDELSARTREDLGDEKFAELAAEEARLPIGEVLQLALDELT